MKSGGSPRRFKRFKARKRLCKRVEPGEHRGYVHLVSDGGYRPFVDSDFRPAQHGGECVLVNLTASAHGAHSFILRPGQHRWIYKDSDVNFGDAFRSHVDELQKQIVLGAARPHDPMNMAIVREIIRRARTHPAFQPVLRRLLPPG